MPNTPVAKRRIVATGATGYVVQRMWHELTERYDVIALDARTAARSGKEVQGVIQCDLRDTNRDAYRAHFTGADAVIHCAFTTPSGITSGDFTDNSEAKFRAEHENVTMAYNVYQTALEEGVKRIVVASSNHAADFYERLIWRGQWDNVTPQMAPFSDNFYGWAKVAYEQLGFVFATGEVGGRALECVQLRIGGPRDGADLEHLGPGDVPQMHRGLGAYLSQRDQVQLFVKSLETSNIDNEHGVPFQIFYGVSGNSHNFWSIANARKVIGYMPDDNSQIVFAHRIAEIAASGDAK